MTAEEAILEMYRQHGRLVGEELRGALKEIARRLDITYDRVRHKYAEMNRHGKASRTESAQQDASAPGDKSSPNPPGLIEYLRGMRANIGTPVSAVLETCDISPSVLRSGIDLLRSQGTEIYIQDDRVIRGCLQPPSEGQPLGATDICFAVAGDFHFGARACQITALRGFAEHCQKRGVTHILVPGDLVDGAGVYPGQTLEQYASSAEEQEASLVRNLPQGFKWVCIGGNHDYSFMNRGGGHNPLLAIETQREDIVYRGFDKAAIPLLPGVDAVLYHGRRNIPYAKSYHLQKMMAETAFAELRELAADSKERPTVRFLLAGHLHIQIQFMEGAVFCAQCGCFTGRNRLTDIMGVTPTVGGWIIEAGLRGGKVKRFRTDFLIYDEIPDDWKNFEHSPRETQPMNPLFAGGGARRDEQAPSQG